MTTSTQSAIAATEVGSLSAWPSSASETVPVP